MRYYEFAENIIKPKKPLTPDQARIEAMKNQVKNTQKAIKAEKARQKIRAGQQALGKIHQFNNESSLATKQKDNRNTIY